MGSKAEATRSKCRRHKTCNVGMEIMSGSIFARRLIDTVLENNLWQFKNVRISATKVGLSDPTGPRKVPVVVQAHSIIMVFDSIIIVVTLDVHDALTSLLKRSAAPDTYSFVNGLLCIR